MTGVGLEALLSSEKIYKPFVKVNGSWNSNTFTCKNFCFCPYFIHSFLLTKVEEMFRDKIVNCVKFGTV